MPPHKGVAQERQMTNKLKKKKSWGLPRLPYHDVTLLLRGNNFTFLTNELRKVFPAITTLRPNVTRGTKTVGQELLIDVHSNQSTTEEECACVRRNSTRT